MYQTKYPTQLDLTLATKSPPFLITREIIECDTKTKLPTLQSLFQEIYSDPDTIQDHFSLKTNKTWNIMFHEMMKYCNLEEDIPLSSLPK